MAAVPFSPGCGSRPSVRVVGTPAPSGCTPNTATSYSPEGAVPAVSRTPTPLAVATPGSELTSRTCSGVMLDRISEPFASGLKAYAVALVDRTAPVAPKNSPSASAARVSTRNTIRDSAAMIEANLPRPRRISLSASIIVHLPQ